MVAVIFQDFIYIICLWGTPCLLLVEKHHQAYVGLCV